MRVWALGVLPEYQHTGVAAKFYIEHFETAARRPQKGGETGWILEENTAMNKAMEAMGGDIVKTFRIFEKGLAPRTSGPRPDGKRASRSRDRGLRPLSP